MRLININTFCFYLLAILFVGCKSLFNGTYTDKNVNENVSKVENNLIDEKNEAIADSIRKGYFNEVTDDGMRYTNYIQDSISSFLMMVIPNAYYVITRMGYLNRTETTTILIGGNTYHPVAYFNKILQLSSNKNVSQEDKIKALLMFFEKNYYIEPSYKITETKVEFPKSEYSYNYEVEDIHDSSSKYYLCVSDELFIAIVKYSDGKYHSGQRLFLPNKDYVE